MSIPCSVKGSYRTSDIFFECQKCRKENNVYTLGCWNTVSHGGAICHDCIDKLEISTEKKTIMKQDRWDWNFGRLEIRGTEPRFE